MAATLVEIPEEKRGGVRPPGLHGHAAVEVELQVGAGAGREIPDARSLVPVALVLEGEALIARNRRPALGEEGHPLVDEVADALARPCVENAECLVDDVALLRVLDAEKRSVEGEPAEQETSFVVAPDSQPARRTSQLAHRLAVPRDVDREPVSVADSGRDDARSLCQPLAPAVRDALEERPRLTAGKRLDEPPAGLVAGLVVEPEHTLAVERRGAVRDADRALAHLTAHARRDVPGVDLPHAGLVRRIDGAVGREGGPVREERHRRPEPLLPGRSFDGRHDPRG